MTLLVTGIEMHLTAWCKARASLQQVVMLVPLPDAQPDTPLMQLHAIPLSSVVAHQKEDVLK